MYFFPSFSIYSPGVAVAVTLLAGLQREERVKFKSREMISPPVPSVLLSETFPTQRRRVGSCSKQVQVQSNHFAEGTLG